MLTRETGLLVPIYQIGKEIHNKKSCDLKLFGKPAADENEYGFPDRVAILNINFPSNE